VFSDPNPINPRELIAYLDLVSRVCAEDKRKTFDAQRIAAGMRVLDAGCGTGDDVRTLSAIVGSQGSVVGVDASTAMIEEARMRGTPPNAEFIVASIERLPFADACFDAARAERLFQHLPDPQAAALELRRVLKPGGSLLLLDQDWESLMIAGADPAVTRRIVRAFADSFANPWAGREARGLLRRAGFVRAGMAPLVAAPDLPVAFELILQPAIGAALRAAAVDASTTQEWLHSLLQSERRGEFFCAVVVTIAMAGAP
jgi:SAM-dependent methyltransferase